MAMIRCPNCGAPATRTERIAGSNDKVELGVAAEAIDSKKQKKIRFVSNLLFLQMAGAEGIEPSLAVLETDALPLNHAPKSC